MLLVLGLLAALELTAAGSSASRPTRLHTARSTIKRGPQKKLSSPLVLYSVNRGRTLMLQRDRNRRFPAAARRAFGDFMRCHHTGRFHAMAPRLLDLLAEIADHYFGARIEIISGYRAPSVARNPRSPHKQGLAADIRVVGIPTAALRDYLRNNFAGIGVGWYPNPYTNFVHVDVGRKKNVFWIDYSGPGEAPVYSPSPLQDLLKTG